MARAQLDIERIEEIEALEKLKEDWNALLEHNETKTVELTYEWQITYWKHFNQNSGLFVLVIREADSIVAVAPLRLTYTREFGIRARELEFIAAQESNYQDFIVGNRSEEVRECILDYLISNRELWDVLSLRHVPETSTTAHFFLNKLGDSLLCRADAEKCIFLAMNKTWEEYAADTERARAKLAYRLRKLRRLGGELVYFHCLDEEQFRSNLLKFFELHRKRWAQTETPSQFNDARYCKFYLDVIPQLLPRGQIDLFVLKAGETTVASLFSFLFDRTYLQQLTAYDTDYSQGSPSLVMHELFVKQAFADGIEVFDFGHYYPYKELWADRFKNRLNIEIYPKRLLPYCIYVLAQMYESLRARSRRITPLAKSVRYIRRKVRALARVHQ
jgi:CelD/BcsL family acetyltransferase involved in cellulose biosynthesis